MTPGYVLIEVSKAFGVPMNFIMGRKRNAEISLARNVAMKIMRRHCGLSTTHIGRLLNRDHSTVVKNTKKLRY